MKSKFSYALLFCALVGTVPGLTHSRDAAFDATFEELLAGFRNDFSDRNSNELIKRMHDHGSNAEVQTALWRVLNDQNRINDWTNALLLGRDHQVSQSEMLKWVRDNLTVIVERAPLGIFTMLENILVTGEIADAERLRSIGARLPEVQAERAAKIRKTADSVIARIEYLNEFREKAAKINQHESNTKPQFSPPPKDSIGKNIAESPLLASGESHPWLVCIAVVISALGVIWLSLKKKSSSSHTSRNRP
jgi:hypothetical protein